MEHDCSVLRSIGYYLEALLCLAPFMKYPLKIVLRGVTNDQVDPSVSTEVRPGWDFSSVCCHGPVSKKKVSYKHSLFSRAFCLPLTLRGRVR